MFQLDLGFYHLPCPLASGSYLFILLSVFFSGFFDDIDLSSSRLDKGTFLSWLNFTVILGGLAVGLLNFGDKVGRISAGLFTLVAMAAMLYALFTFHWRAKSIRLRGQGGFDDRFGPSVLAVALLAAVVVNFVLRITAGGDK